MPYLFYLLVAFSFTVIETTILPIFSIFQNFFDLQLVLVIYLGFFTHLGRTLPLVIFMGFIMDSVSGGPFGLYLTVYVWLFAGVNLLSGFFYHGGKIIVPLLMVLGVLVQNIIILSSIAIMDKQLAIFAEGWSLVVKQLLWALLIGPFVFKMIKVFHGIWELCYEKIAGRLKERRR